jgi:hypothetical protein
MLRLHRRRVATLACALLAAACASASRSGEMEPRFIAVHNAFAAMGLAQVGPIQRGSLGEGRESRVPIELAAGCTTVVALGGDGVRDLDAALVDPNGTPIAHDTTRDPQAVVRACVDHAGTYALVVKMSEGAGEFLEATWSGGAQGPAQGQSSAGEGVAANVSAAPGTCDAPIPLTAGQFQGSTARGNSDNEASCASSASREIVYRMDVATRQRATIDVDPRFDSVLYVRKDDCADTEAEVACNDDVGHERRSRIDAVLDPGAYFVFVDGLANESGAYHLKVALDDVPTLADVCRGARPIASGITVSGSTSGAFDSAESTCGDEAKGDDVAYRFDMTTRARVRIAERSSDISPVVHLRRTCTDEQSEVACSEDGMSDDVATFTGVLDVGSYAVFADSSGREQTDGRFTLLAETSPPQGTGAPGDSCSDALPLASGKVDGDTFASRDDVLGTCGGAGAPDEVYRVDIARRSRITARMARQEGHHVFLLTRACGDRSAEMACGTAIDQTVAPGTYWLAVDGATASDFGRYEFEARVRDVAGQEAACKGAPPLRAGVAVNATTTGAGDRFTTSCGGREEDQANPDRIYRLDLAHRAHVQINLATPSWDGVLVVRRTCLDSSVSGAAGAASAEVRCNNDYEDTHHARLDMTLDAGAYYVVVDGHAKGNEGAFTLEYKVLK